jgi:hypothetical protein
MWSTSAALSDTPGGKYKMAVLLKCAAWLEGTFTPYEGEAMALEGPTLKFIRETDGDEVTDEFEMFEGAQLAAAAHLNAAAAAAVRAVDRVPQGGRLVPKKLVDLAVIQLFRDAPESLIGSIGVAISALIALLANIDPDTDFTTLREGMGSFTNDVLPAGLSMNLWETTAGFVDRSTAGLFNVMKTLADHADYVKRTISRRLQGVSASRRNSILQRGVRAVANAPTALAQMNAYEQQVALLHPVGLMEEFEEALADEIDVAGVQAILAALQARHAHNPPARMTRFPGSRVQTAAPKGVRGRKKRRGKTKGRRRAKSARSKRRRRGRSGKGHTSSSIRAKPARG